MRASREPTVRKSRLVGLIIALVVTSVVLVASVLGKWDSTSTTSTDSRIDSGTPVFCEREDKSPGSTLFWIGEWPVKCEVVLAEDSDQTYNLDSSELYGVFLLCKEEKKKLTVDLLLETKTKTTTKSWSAGVGSVNWEFAFERSSSKQSTTILKKQCEAMGALSS